MRTVVVTGVASPIGRATADLLHRHGERVIGVGETDTGSHADVVADLAHASGRAELVRRVTTLSGGRLDAIVVAASAPHPTTTALAVHVFGAIATLEGLRPLLAHSDAPRAVVVCPTAAREPVDEGLVELCLAGDEAAAVHRATALVEVDGGRTIDASCTLALTRWVRRSAAGARWAGAGVPLNAVAPGALDPGPCGDWTADPWPRTPSMPLHSPMCPQVPARMVVWLAGEECSHVCGQVVVVDGGADALTYGDTPR